MTGVACVFGRYGVKAIPSKAPGSRVLDRCEPAPAGGPAADDSLRLFASWPRSAGHGSLPGGRHRQPAQEKTGAWSRAHGNMARNGRQETSGPARMSRTTSTGVPDTRLAGHRRLQWSEAGGVPEPSRGSRLDAHRLSAPRMLAIVVGVGGGRARSSAPWWSVIPAFSSNTVVNTSSSSGLWPVTPGMRGR